MTLHVVSAMDSHNQDFVILAAFTDPDVAAEYCAKASKSTRYTDIRVHHPLEVDVHTGFAAMPTYLDRVETRDDGSSYD